MVEMNEVTIIVNHNSNNVLIVNDDLDLRESYSLDKMPGEDSMIIQQDKQQIYQGLQIGSIIVNLQNAAGLMLVAATALTGESLNSRMSKLHKRFLDTCSESLLSVTAFVDRSKAVTEYIIKAYDWLIKGKENVAMKQFERCSNEAKIMADKADALAKSFYEMSEEAENVLEATQDEDASQRKKIEALKNELADFQANLEAQKARQEQLLEDISDINKTYEQMRRDEKELMDRQFKMQIISILGSFASEMIGAFTPDAGMLSGNDGNPLNLLQQEYDKANRDLQLKEKEKAENQEKKEDLEQKRDGVEKNILDLRGKGSLDEKNAASLQSMVSMVGAYNVEIQLVTAAIELASKKISEISSRMKEVVSKIDEVTKSMQSDLERISAEKRRVLDSKLKLEEERRSALMDIRKFTVLIKNNADTRLTTEMALETLQVAVECLKQIVTALETASLFWRSLQRYCEALAEKSIQLEIEDVMDAYEPEERIPMYREPLFMLKMVQYLCKWSALYYVSREYLEETKKVREQVVQGINYAPTQKEARDMAPKLADEMQRRIDKQILESNEITNYIMGV